jgi:hypothetical protein
MLLCVFHQFANGTFKGRHDSFNLLNSILLVCVFSSFFFYYNQHVVWLVCFKQSPIKLFQLITALGLGATVIRLTCLCRFFAKITPYYLDWVVRSVVNMSTVHGQTQLRPISLGV